MFQQQVPLDPFESFSDGDDNDDNDSIMIGNLGEIKHNVFVNDIDERECEKLQPPIGSSLALIQKLMEDATEEATAGNIELFNHLQSMMTKVVADI